MANRDEPSSKHCWPVKLIQPSSLMRAQGRMRAKRAELEQALVGTITAHHRFLLREQLDHFDSLNQAILRVSNEIEERMHALDPVEKDTCPSQQTSQEQELLSWNGAIALLDTIPGINQRAAEGILAEIGTEMTRFTNAHHLASWAGACNDCWEETHAQRAMHLTKEKQQQRTARQQHRSTLRLAVLQMGLLFCKARSMQAKPTRIPTASQPSLSSLPRSTHP